jgi:hypothetical protein
MNDLSLVSEKKQSNEKTFAWIEALFYLCALLNVAANFAGSPLVKYCYLLMVAILPLGILFLPLERLVWPMLTLSFFEGQGRVIFGYGAFFRIVFDLYFLILVGKSIIKHKRLLDRSKVPKHIYIGLILHFAWFFLECFNPEGAGFFPSLATAKYYIFPFLLFFYFQENKVILYTQESQKHILRVLFIFSLLAVLTIFQNNEGADFMHDISSNYSNLFKKYAEFSEERFRPWGTSHSPGGMSVYFFPLIPFFFLLKPSILIPKNIPLKLIVESFRWLSISFVLFASFICQVRSATLKLVVLLLLCALVRFIGSRQKFKKIVIFASVLFFAYLGSSFFIGKDLVEEYNLEGTIKRWTQLKDEGVGAQREGLDAVFDTLEKRTNFPFGLGPGMSTGFLPQFAARRNEMIDTPVWWFWSMDNLYVFLFLELGIGAIFYIFIVLSFFMATLSMVVRCLRSRDIENYELLGFTFSYALIVLVGNWGAVGLPFNPESFYFWLLMAIGFNAFQSRQASKEELAKV